MIGVLGLNKLRHKHTAKEKQLKQAAAEAATYNDYMAKQQHLLAQQEKAIAKLMQQNKASLKRLKK